MREPRAMPAEFGVTLPKTTELRVHDSTADMRYIVLPFHPDGWAESDLAALVTRDSMIGTGLVKTPG